MRNYRNIASRPSYLSALASGKSQGTGNVIAIPIRDSVKLSFARSFVANKEGEENRKDKI